MKTNISAQLLAHLAGPALTLSWFWILRREDGLILGFTTHVEDQPIVSKLTGVPPIVGYPIGTVFCKSTASFIATDIEQNDSLAQNNLEVTAVVDDDAVTEEDIRAGLWRNAKLEIGITNYRDLSMGTDTLFMGSIGNISTGDISYKAEQRGLTQPLEAGMDGMTSETCDAKVGDARCGVNINLYRKTGTVGTVVGDLLITDTARSEPDGWWMKGLLTMTSGASVGQTKEVKRSTALGVIELVEEFFFGIAPSDTYAITPGCNKLNMMADGTYTGDCRVKFVLENPIGNVRRFRGFRVPGQIKISQYGGQDAAS